MAVRRSRPSAVHRGAPRASGALARQAYRRLKALILTSRVLPGDRLLHRVLVQHHVPNVGYSVREMGAREAEQLFEAREALEGATAGLAAERMRAADLRRVERAARDGRPGLRSGRAGGGPFRWRPPCGVGTG